MDDRILLVVNPAAGKKCAKALARKLISALEQARFTVTRVDTVDIEDPEDSENPGSRRAPPGESVRIPLKEKSIDDLQSFRAALVLGGDGTMNEFLNALEEFQCPVGFIGVGTVNVLSRELKLPMPKRDKDWERRIVSMVRDGDRLLVPIANASGGSGARRFLMFAEAGLLGRVVVRVNAWRERTKRHGKAEFVLFGLASLFSFGRPIRATCVLEDGSRTEISCSNVLATRVRHYAGTMPMPGTTTLAERAFDTIAWRSRWFGTHFLLLVIAIARCLPWIAWSPLIEPRKATEIEIDEPLGNASHADAEDLGGRHIRLWFDSGVIPLLVPRPSPSSSEMRQRVITAVVLLGLLLSALSMVSPWPFALLTLLLIGCAAWEWGRLNKAPAAGAIALGVATSLLGLMAGAGLLPRGLAAVWWLAGVLWVLGGSLALHAGVARWLTIPRACRWLIGPLVLCAAWVALFRARSIGANFLLSILALVWTTDIAALYGGKKFGKHPLAPTISPKKSWEGVCCGMSAALLVATMWCALEHWIAPSSQSLYRQLFERLGIARTIAALLFLVAMSIVGDLFESLVKRAADAKDSSRLLPGHGGVLDRIDALLPVLPLALVLGSL